MLPNKKKIYSFYFERTKKMVNTKQLLQELGQYAPFENSEWQIRVRGSTDSDKRLMTFVDNLWGFEVTGGEYFFKRTMIGSHCAVK